jgi:hypothetical protein
MAIQMNLLNSQEADASRWKSPASRQVLLAMEGGRLRQSMAAWGGLSLMRWQSLRLKPKAAGAPGSGSGLGTEAVGCRRWILGDKSSRKCVS